MSTTRRDLIPFLTPAGEMQAAVTIFQIRNNRADFVIDAIYYNGVSIGPLFDFVGDTAWDRIYDTVSRAIASEYHLKSA